MTSVEANVEVKEVKERKRRAPSEYSLFTGQCLKKGYNMRESAKLWNEGTKDHSKIEKKQKEVVSAQVVEAPVPAPTPAVVEAPAPVKKTRARASKVSK